MTQASIHTRQRWLSPEVVQTSDTDCGPAALKSMLEGFGVHASYGRLREACQTDVDGTSINTIEDVAGKLGLHADQMMLPADHLLLAEALVLPAIVVVRLPDGSTHFVVLWRRHGRFVQIMDPATGRRWLTARRFLSEVYVHSMPVPAADWREWAASEPSLAAMKGRMSQLGIPYSALLDSAVADPGWRGLAALDAAIRMAQALVQSGALARGREITSAVERLSRQQDLIPVPYWSVRPMNGPPDGKAEQLTLRGAVLIHIRGVGKQAPSPASAELNAALTEHPSRPGRELLRLLRADGVLIPGILLSALLFATGGLIAEAVLLRGLLELAGELASPGARMAAIGTLLAFFAFLLMLEVPLTSGLFRYGRRFEIRLRQAFLEKIPRLGDRYFSSRLKSDMAERSHSIHRIRQLPELGSILVRSVFELVLTTVGIIWLDPASAPLAIAASTAAVLIPLAVQPVIMERELRERTLGGALGRFYLDALLGLFTIRAHGAERVVRRGHARMLRDWARAGLRLQRAVMGSGALQMAAGYVLAAWLLLDYVARRGEAGSVLLLAYWAVNLTVTGQQIGNVAWQYPAFRNMTLRLIEPLGALEEKTLPAHPGSSHTASDTRMTPGAGISFEDVRVVAGGHTILENLSLDIPAGSHVAIIGPSGAGKSSLVGLLLGWHKPAQGTILVDESPLKGDFETLRRDTAWVDPSVQLWNRSLQDNLRYGNSKDSAIPLNDIIDDADLRAVLGRLPNGLESPLGEAGALVSGGEGQRIRFARSLLRPGVRLVILDEPFRGLDWNQRHDLLARARRMWRDATLFYITHDVASTRSFDRVLILEAGRIVEDGMPASLAEQSTSRYRALLDAETAAQNLLWSNDAWQRLRLENGRVIAEGRSGDS